MSQPEQQDQGEQAILKPVEAKALQAADAQAAKMAGAAAIEAAQALNPDRHSGSAGGDQNESIEIMAVGKDGRQQVLAVRPKEPKQEAPLTPEYLRERAKQDDVWAMKFVAEIDQAQKLPSPYREGQKAKVLKDAEAVYRPKGQAEKPQEALDQMDTGTMLAHEVKRNPAAEPVQNLHTWAKKLPEGPEKERYSQLVRDQMAELSPEAKAGADRLAQVNERIKAAGLDQGDVHEAVKPHQLVLQGQAKYQENEWEGFNRLGPKQQRETIEAFGKASDIAQDSYKSQIQAVAESVPKGFYNVGKGLYDSGIAAGTLMIEAAQRPEKIPEAAHKLADNLSAAIMSGVKVSQVVAGYSQEVAQSGDYSRPLRDLQTVTTLANERWEAMPLEKRTEKASELIAEMGIGSAIAAADRLAKSGKLIDALEDLAKYAKDLTAPGREKAKQAIGAFLHDVFQPKGLTTNGFEMPIPKQQPDIDDLAMLRNKGLPDDVKPSQKVLAKASYDSQGELIGHIEVPESVLRAAEIQGISRAVAQEKLQKIANAVKDVYAEMGNYKPNTHGTERSYGNQFHEKLRQRLLRMGDSQINPETSYLKGDASDWGKLGTSRVDVSLGDKKQPFASICLKTLKAVPSAQQERGWFRNLPKLKDGTVPPRLHLKLGE